MKYFMSFLTLILTLTVSAQTELIDSLKSKPMSCSVQQTDEYDRTFEWDQVRVSYYTTVAPECSGCGTFDIFSTEYFDASGDQVKLDDK